MARTKGTSKKEMPKLKDYKKIIPLCGSSYQKLANLLGIDRRTAIKFVGSKPSLVKMWDEYVKQMINYAEDVVHKSIVEEGNVKTAKWYLTQMSDKYKTKTKLEVEGDISVNIILDEAKKDIEDKD